MGPFRVEQAPLDLGAVASLGEIEDLKRVPAPRPTEEAVDGPGTAPGIVPPPAPPVLPGGPTERAPGAPSESPLGPPTDPAPATPTDPAPGAPAHLQEGGGGAGGGQDAPGTGAPPPVVAQVLPAGPRITTRILDLAGALRIAFANNRDYQAQREALYLTALSLTLARYDFAPRFFGVVTGDWNHDASGSESGSIDSSFGFDLLLVNGARLSISLFNNLFQFFTGDRREVARTIVSGTLTQPLLRGFGSEIVREPLTQAERDVTYEIRAFERFGRTFAVAVTSEYYRVLQERDRVTNAYLNWQSLVNNHDRARALANAERLPRYEVDQARQEELLAEDNWNTAVEQYESALDRFKITLGISINEGIALSQGELERLSSEPVEALAVTLEAAIQNGLVARLDLVTARNQVDDAERQIRVAADALRAQLDLRTEAALESEGVDDQKPFKFNTADFVYGFGFDLDLPLDRKRERNAYVASVIALERDRRDLSRLEDEIRLTVRDSYRRLEREIVSHAIQRVGLALAEQRVDSTTELRQAGRATTRDVLESQSALNSARNALTSSLINYAIARLEFLRDTEMLRVTASGQVSAVSIGDTL